MIYVLLPVWQEEFALGYGALAALRGLYAGAMAALLVEAELQAAEAGGYTTVALGRLIFNPERITVGATGRTR